MKIEEINCKTALSKSRLPGLNYSLNPYIGCMHQCKYCYAPSILHLSNNEWSEIVKIKRNIPRILSKELKSKKPGTIGISTVTDPYQPIEKTFQLTYYCLEVLKKYDFPISIQTKSDLVIRDIDIIQEFSDAEIMVSIGTLNDSHRKLLEPNSSSIPDRLKILRNFSNTNVKTSVFFGPIYPTIKEDEIIKIMDLFIDLNISEIMVDSLHLKPGIIKLIQAAVEENILLEKFFTYDNLKNKTKYEKIRKIIKNYLRDTKVKFQDAFN